MKKHYVTAFAFFVIAVVFLTGVANFVHQMERADQKAFWLDEEFGLAQTVHENSYRGLLAKAAVRSEANAAPLDYLFVKVLDDLKKPTGQFGLSDRTYYRLWANFVMVFSGFLIVCLFARSILRSPTSDPIRIFQLLLLMLLPLLYLYRPMTYHYAAEARPYALWFSLWFVSTALCSQPRVSKITLALCLSLLAMTMAGSLFQILAVGTAYCAVRQKEQGWKQALKESLQIIGVPLFLVVFYAFPADYGRRYDGTWEAAWRQFYELWSHELVIVPMLLLMITLLYQAKQTRPQITGPLAVLIIFLMGPAIFMLTLGRGYFFTERQYIYYDAHRAVFWLSLINVLPCYLEKIKDQRRQLLAMLVILVVWLPFVFSKKNLSRIKNTAASVVSALPSGAQRGP